MENDFKDKLKNLVNSSKLNKDQKDLWELFMIISIPEEDEAIFEAASENEENLFLLSKYLRDKLYDMKSRNKQAWNKLVKDEIRYAGLLN